MGSDAQNRAYAHPYFWAPFFLVGEYKVWGATAMMLSEFVERLRAVA